VMFVARAGNVIANFMNVSCSFRTEFARDFKTPSKDSTFDRIITRVVATSDRRNDDVPFGYSAYSRSRFFLELAYRVGKPIFVEYRKGPRGHIEADALLLVREYRRGWTCESVRWDPQAKYWQ